MERIPQRAEAHNSREQLMQPAPIEVHAQGGSSYLVSTVGGKIRCEEKRPDGSVQTLRQWDNLPEADRNGIDSAVKALNGGPPSYLKDPSTMNGRLRWD